MEDGIKVEGFDFSGLAMPAAPVEKKVEIQQTEEPEESKEESKEESLRNVELEDFEILEVLHVSPLEPMIVYMSVKRKSESSEENSVLGVCGFYDPLNKMFMNTEIKPVLIDGFEEKFKKFIEKKNGETDQGAD